MNTILLTVLFFSMMSKAAVILDCCKTVKEGEWLRRQREQAQGSPVSAQVPFLARQDAPVCSAGIPPLCAIG